MREQALQLPLPGFERAEAAWRRDYGARMGDAINPRNRSGIEVKPLYSAADWSAERYMADLGFPGQPPMTRGIYPSMHRGRSWSQRQLIGFGTPEDYAARLDEILAAGASAISLIPCNSVYRGYDVDQVDPLLLGTCGATINTVDDMDVALRAVDIGRISTAMNDPLPFTLLALLLAVAKRRGVPWTKITGTSNQSDYISHFVANHMFFRLALPGSRRVLVDHIAFCQARVPGWNPLSVVGQHMQQAGATPAQAMGLTLSTAIQYAEDCIARGLDPEVFLEGFTFFFDISISFFEEIAKFRAGRRIWARLVRERFGVRNPKAWRFKFHAQTSGVDLTRQQPLNNIARVAIQAMAGIFGGLQSLHSDAYDEVLSVPTEAAARVAVSTQNILREEAHLTDVIDPLGGSFYVERLTEQMEAEIEAAIARIDAAGGMYAAAESGLVQSLLGESARAFQERIERGEETIVGVTAHQRDQEDFQVKPLERPEHARMEAQIAKFQAFKAARNQTEVARALDALARAAGDQSENLFERVVDAAVADVTHGEICACLRREFGFGQPLVVA
ncbi:MAG: methylmalonyl-CoA mutase family protein [Alphaproteobacteria bacterium]